MVGKLRLAAFALSLAAGGAVAAQSPPATQQAAADNIDPAAVAALEASKAYLRTLKSFELRVQSTADQLDDEGAKLELINRVRYEYRAPDKLFVDWRSDREARRIYFDGKTLTVYAPRAGYFASVAQTGSVADVLTKVAAKYGVTVPLPDIFYWASSGSPAYTLLGARKIGYARIADADTDQYLFRQADVDWQVWIERSDKPLPRKIVITDRSNPAQPKFSALLQWNPNVDLPDSRFVFTPGDGAKAVTLGQVSKEGAAK